MTPYRSMAAADVSSLAHLTNSGALSWLPVSCCRAMASFAKQALTKYLYLHEGGCFVDDTLGNDCYIQCVVCAGNACASKNSNMHPQDRSGEPASP